MTTVGIDKISFYTANYYLDLACLAKARKVDVNKFYLGLGQYRMSVPPPDEDIVTMAANAAYHILADEDVGDISTLLFATESSIDQSKSAGMYVHRLINLPEYCRVLELKQACASSSQALHLACALLLQHRQTNHKVLIVASDIARYGLNSQGEPTQGCGAVAMLITLNPRIVAIEPHCGLYSQDVMDFWRPNYLPHAMLEGRYSAKMYLHVLQQVWRSYQILSGLGLKDHDYFVYHSPVARLVEKAHKLMVESEGKRHALSDIKKELANSLHYSREMGNTYTAALYISLISLLEHNHQDMSQRRIGFYAYGSGCVGEYFSGVVQPGYQDFLYSNLHQTMLKKRNRLDIEQYEYFFKYSIPEDGSTAIFPKYHHGKFRLTGIDGHKRCYTSNRDYDVMATHVDPIAHLSQSASKPSSSLTKSVSRVIVPGKIIISGEYAIIHNKPAIAIAVNRFVETTIVSKKSQDISFDLFDINYHKSMGLQALRELKSRLKRKYRQFLAGHYAISDVLKEPFQLIQFATARLLDYINHNERLKQKLAITDDLLSGCQIKTTSSIPVGCGMGSSAATALSVIYALNEHYQLSLNDHVIVDLAYEIESLQHGHPGRIDLSITKEGGCIYLQNKTEIEPRTIANIPFFIVNTGKPVVSTGTCVVEVSQQFAGNDPIWDQFALVTQTIDQALQQNDLATLARLIKENHQLLNHIGVVPKRVNHFIQDIEAIGGAAKVCGAGAVKGENAGLVLVLTDDLDQLKKVASRYGYQAEPVTIESKGMRIVS